MSEVPHHLPLEATQTPADQAAAAEMVRVAAASGTPLYPLGGCTAQDYGLVPQRAGLGLATTALSRVLDYPARDMTITVEAGITLRKLAGTMSPERQRLPVDVAAAEHATLGGAIATNASGPRRYGHGTLRDWVIGISAIDGRGVPFKAGGRVVKNVAGYDLCKLLTGSLGTLGVITQVTLKVQPVPEVSAWVATDLTDFFQVERFLHALGHTRTRPAAVELLAGPAWARDPALPPLATGAIARLLVAFEGPRVEIDWMVGTLTGEWRGHGAPEVHVVSPGLAGSLWTRLIEFPATRAPLVLKLNVPASKVAWFTRDILALGREVSLSAHAGNGILHARFAEFTPADVGNLLVRQMQPWAQAVGGSAVVLSSQGLGELTRQVVWGGARAELALMQAVKRQFDPHQVLNPGRFVFAPL